VDPGVTRTTIALLACLAGCSAGEQVKPERGESAVKPEPDDAAVKPSPAQVESPGAGFLVEWGGASVFGADHFTIDGAGAMRIQASYPGQPPVDRTASATPEELRELEDSLRAARCCDLRSARDIGVPDEGHTTMRLGFASVSCEVSLWDNEWHEQAGAKRCAAIIQKLRGRASGP
jgi:hypothetical protein